MDIEFARQQMVAQQARAWDVFDALVLEVLAETPRERFVPPEFLDLAFADTGIPLPHGQRMMTPTVEGRLLQALKLNPCDSVLEIGTGSGFVTACMARLAQTVVSVDIFPDLTETAGRTLCDTGVDNVSLMTLDACKEMPDGQFDAIAVTGSLPLFDTRFFEALKPGGRLFVIVGNAPVMDAQVIVRGEDDMPGVSSLFETCVSPLVNAAAPPAFHF